MVAAALPDMLRNTVDQIRYALPSGDNNLARWADHPLADLTRSPNPGRTMASPLQHGQTFLSIFKGDAYPASMSSIMY